MTNILLTIHVILAIGLIIVILLQRSDGGALGGIGGGMSFGGIMSGRSSANFLTRLTAVLAAFFIITSLGLAIIESNSKKSESILEEIEEIDKGVPLLPVEENTNSTPVPPKAE